MWRNRSHMPYSKIRVPTKAVLEYNKAETVENTAENAVSNPPEMVCHRCRDQAPCQFIEPASA